MDLNLITGQPGASKTLNTIKMVEERRIVENRPVFYYGINGLKLDWHRMPDPDLDSFGQPSYPPTWYNQLAENPDLITPHSWYNAPVGAIIVIDECQFVYPVTAPTAKQPIYIAKMATFRHSGISMYLITQGPNLINHLIRDWVQPHIHFKRIWGGSRVVKFVNESCIDNPRNTASVGRDAIRSVIKIDKSYFDKYISAAAHTSNKRVNKKMLMMLILPLFIAPFGIYTAFSKLQQQDDHLQPADTAALEAGSDVVAANAVTTDAQLSLGQSMTQGTEYAEQRFDPMTAYIPRIEAMPETAPAYDELRKPVDFPRPQCLANANSCVCYSQQGTLLADYPESVCRANVQHGYFDPTKPRSDPPQRQENRPSAQPIVGA